MDRPVHMQNPAAPTLAEAGASDGPRASAAGSLAPDDPRIAAAQVGDRDALEWLVAKLLPRTRNLVRFLMPGDQDVDDFAQASMLEIVRALPTFEGRSLLTTWADRITVRETLRRAKRRRLQAFRQREFTAEELQLLPAASLDQRYHERRQVVAMLDELPEAQRHVLVLHHVMGMSVPEVAEALGLPFDTAKSRLRLATQRLRKLYGGTDGGS